MTILNLRVAKGGHGTFALLNLNLITALLRLGMNGKILVTGNWKLIISKETLLHCPYKA